MLKHIEGFCPVKTDGEPPGKLHSQLAIGPSVEVDKSVKPEQTGAQPVPEPEKFATG